MSSTFRQRIDSLIPREHQVLELVVTGMLTSKSPARLGAAAKAIKIHRGRIMAKMHAKSLVDLANDREGRHRAPAKVAGRTPELGQVRPA